MTPFQALYGKPPRITQTYLLGSSSIEVVETKLITREEVLQQKKQDILKAQKRMKQADKHRRELSFHVGDLVMVKLHPYK